MNHASAQPSEALTDSLLTSFDTLAHACMAEIDGTITPAVLATLHSPPVRQARVGALIYLATCLDGDEHLARLRGDSSVVVEEHDARRRTAWRLHRHTLALTPMPHDGESADVFLDFDVLERQVMAALLPYEHRRIADDTARTLGIDPGDMAPPQTDLWAWAAYHRWVSPSSARQSAHLLSLDFAEFAEAVRADLSREENPWLADRPVVERWLGALVVVERTIEQEIKDLAQQAGRQRHRQRAVTFSRIDALYLELAMARFRRCEADRWFREFSEGLHVAISNAWGLGDELCQAAADAHLRERYPHLQARVREAVRQRREPSPGRRPIPDGFLVPQVVAELSAHRPRGAVTQLDLSAQQPPLVVAADVSEHPSSRAFFYAWAAHDGQAGYGSTAALTSSEGELAAICHTVLAPQLADRRLRILSDCQSAISALGQAAAAQDVRALPFKVTTSTRHLTAQAIAHADRFTIEWIKGHNGHPLNEAANDLARAARHIPPNPAAAG